MNHFIIEERNKRNIETLNKQDDFLSIWFEQSLKKISDRNRYFDANKNLYTSIRHN
jgi:hypothetical protein